MANNSKITLQLPEELEFVLGKYEQDGIEYTINEGENGKIEITSNINENESIKIEIKVKAKTPKEGELIGNISSIAKMEANNFEEKQIGEIKHKIQRSAASSGENNIDIDEEGNVTYKIRGIAWLDKNKNGEREDGEKVLAGIKVYLMNTDGSIVKDSKTEEEKIVITDSDGEYAFRNLTQGNYIVLFVYNSEEYDITEYQKQGVVGERNSDVILTRINFEGTEQDGAVTDIIKITNRNVTNIDIGLQAKPIFDLKIETNISKITVQTSKETVVHEYNTNFAKAEIHSKKIKGAKVLIEYNIMITNTGDIPGSASKIASEITEGLGFSAELNTQWYIGNDKKIYTTSLAKEILQPGESKGIRLILVKNMTEKNTGTYENKTRIIDVYNEKELQDKEKENNESKAICLITISTGEAVFYTSIAVLILSILAIGILIIRRFAKDEVKVYR